MNTSLKCSTGLLAIALSGCMSTQEVIEPVPFDTNNSYAMNIANQTALTRNDSPLRDITQDEISDISRKVRESSGGDASIFFGALNVLTGKFIGIIDIAGGVVSNIASSSHTASQPRWIITVDYADFNSAKDAELYIIEKTEYALKKTLSEYGQVEFKPIDGLDGYGMYYLNNDIIVTGMRVIEPQGTLVKHTKINFGDGLKQSWEYGVLEARNDQLGSILVQPPSPILLQRDNDKVTYTDFYKTLTRFLPKGFYVYTPSFPSVIEQTEEGRFKFTNTKEILPAIYTQGEKFTFTKPQ